MADNNINALTAELKELRDRSKRRASSVVVVYGIGLTAIFVALVLILVASERHSRELARVIADDNNRIAQLDAKISQVNEEIEKLPPDPYHALTELSEDMARVKVRLSSLERRMTELEQRVSHPEATPTAPAPPTGGGPK